MLTKEEIEALVEGPLARVKTAMPHHRQIEAADLYDLTHLARVEISRVLNAAHDLARALLAALARAEDAEMAHAALLQEAADACRYLHVIKIEDRHGPWNSAVLQCCELIRALVPDAGIKALAELRKERDEYKKLAVAGNLVALEIRTVEAERDALRARLAETEGKVGALRKAVDFLRTTIRSNIVVKPGPHTVELPDGSIHSGPLADFMHDLLPMIADVLDRAALASAQGVKP